MTKEWIDIKGKLNLYTNKSEIITEDFTKKCVKQITRYYKKNMGPNKPFLIFDEEYSYWFKVYDYQYLEFYGRVPLNLMLNYYDSNLVLPKDTYLSFFEVEKGYENYLESSCGFYGKIIGNKVHLFGLDEADHIDFGHNLNRYLFSPIKIFSKKFKRVFVGNSVLNEDPRVYVNFEKMIRHIENCSLHIPPFMFIFKKQGREYWVQKYHNDSKIIMLHLVTKSGNFEKFRKQGFIPGNFMDKHYQNISKNNKGRYTTLPHIVATCWKNPNTSNFGLFIPEEYFKIITL